MNKNRCRTVRTVCLLLSASLASAWLPAAETMSRYFAHPTVEDRNGVIAPWYTGQNGQFDHRVRIASETFRRYPWVGPPKAAGIAPAYAFNNTWRISPEGAITIPPLTDWNNAGRGQGAARAMLAWVEYYRYSGDPAARAQLEVVADTVLRFSQTDAQHPWPGFFISVPVAGKPYGQAHPDGWIQLDIVGEVAVALLRGYQLTGNVRWLEAVKHWADVFVAKRNKAAGEAPWPRYADPEGVDWGRSSSGNIQTAGLVYQLVMFDELIRLGFNGRDNSYVEARDAGRAYNRDVQQQAWIANDTWGRGYWDWEHPVQGQTMTDWAVRYMMDNKDYFPNWKNDVRNILTVFLNHTSVDPRSKGEVYSGAWAFPESSSCCGSSLAWGPMEFAVPFAQYAAEAGDEWAREMARRQQILATYDVHDTGVVEDNIDGGAIAADGWINGAVPSAMKWLLRTMGWMPEILGANRENHIMRSSSVVNSVVYEKGRIVYSTFDAPRNTVDVLRLAFAPTRVTADGNQLHSQSDLAANGYTQEALPSGDFIVHIRHDGATALVVEGNDPQEVADDDSLRFEGAWTVKRDERAWGGAVRTSMRRGAAMEFSFHGNQLRILGEVGPDGGTAEVYVDGIKQLVGIDFWNPQVLHRQTVYYRNGLTQGRHTVRVVARGDRNLISRGKRVAIDALTHSAAEGQSDWGVGGGPTTAQRMIFGYTGRRDYIDSEGHAWRPGTEFVVRSGIGVDSVARNWWTMPQALFVTGTPDQEVYRYGVHASEFTANVTVGPGNYYVRLKFAENHHREANRRAVSIFVNDRKVVDSMDVWATARSTISGAPPAGGRHPPPPRPQTPEHRAVDLVFNEVQPKNGIIEIRLVGESVGGVPTEAILQALEVGPGSGGQGAVPVSVSAR